MEFQQAGPSRPTHPSALGTSDIFSTLPSSATGDDTRLPAPLPQGDRGKGKQQLTPAEEYASAHQPSRHRHAHARAATSGTLAEGSRVQDRDKGPVKDRLKDKLGAAQMVAAQYPGGGGSAGSGTGTGTGQGANATASASASASASGGTSKPLFEWISRKLGAGRRNTIGVGDISNTVHLTSRSSAAVLPPDHAPHHDKRTRYPSLPKNTRHRHHASGPGSGTGGVTRPTINIPLSNLSVGAGRPGRNKSPILATRTVGTGNERTGTSGGKGGSIKYRTNTYTFPRSPPRSQLSPSQVFPATPARESIMSRSESHSMHAYSFASSERERRREANNPYPSMPVAMYRHSIVSTSGAPSLSFVTRSRTPSIRSEASLSSSLRPRISLRETETGSSIVSAGGIVSLDEEEVERASMQEHKPAGPFHPKRSASLDALPPTSIHLSRRQTGTGADENASIRPLPPSNPSSPNPSVSALSQSASTSLLSPSRQPASPSKPDSRPFYGYPSQRPSTQYTASSSAPTHSRSASFDESFISRRDRQSREGSTSTKPTTIVSFDSGPHIAHIAQVPPATLAAPASPTAGGTAGWTPLQASSITSSPVSVSPSISFAPQESLSRTGTAAAAGPSAAGLAGAADITPPRTRAVSQQTTSPPSPDSPLIHMTQAPKHTNPHPINNPHPSSPPERNASTVTLASSTFALPPPTGTVTPGATSGILHMPSSSSVRPRMSGLSGMSSLTSPSLATSQAAQPPEEPEYQRMGSSGLPAPGALPPALASPVSPVPRPPISTSPSVTFAPGPSSNPLQPPFTAQSSASGAPQPHRPTSLAPSARSFDGTPWGRPSSVYSPGPERDRERSERDRPDYPSSLHPTLGTRGTGGWGWMARPGVDEQASVRALRRKGSAGSSESVESRWSWRGGSVGAVGLGMGMGMGWGTSQGAGTGASGVAAGSGVGVSAELNGQNGAADAGSAAEAGKGSANVDADRTGSEPVAA